MSHILYENGAPDVTGVKREIVDVVSADEPRGVVAVAVDLMIVGENRRV